MPLAVARAGLDVLFNAGFTAPFFCPCPCVTTFLDLQHKRHPEYFRWFDLPAWRLCLFQAACTSDSLIAISDATRNDLLRYYPIAESKVHVVPLGVDQRMFEIGRERQGSDPRHYLLCVSTLHPHKNIDRLLRAFAEFSAPRSRVHTCARRHARFSCGSGRTPCWGAGLAGCCPNHRLDSSRPTVPALSRRIRLHLPVDLRRLRTASAGVTGGGNTNSLLGNRTASQPGRRCGRVVRSARRGRTSGGHIPNHPRRGVARMPEPSRAAAGGEILLAAISRGNTSGSEEFRLS